MDALASLMVAGDFKGASTRANAPCDPAIPLSTDPRLVYAYDSTLVALDQWARKGTPAPRAGVIELKDGAVVLDAAVELISRERRPA